MEPFSFDPSFYNRLDEDEKRQRRADNSDYLPSSQHSPDQDYHNCQARRAEKVDRCDHGLNSHNDLSQETTPSNEIDNK